MRCVETGWFVKYDGDVYKVQDINHEGHTDVQKVKISIRVKSYGQSKFQKTWVNVQDVCILSKAEFPEFYL